MPYIKVERKEDELSRNTRKKCKLCGIEIPSASWRTNIEKMVQHTHKEHEEEWEKIRKQKDAYDSELKIFEEKLAKNYPLHDRREGYFFESLPLPPRRMWKCPDCGRVMSPHDRYWHEQNKGRYCKKSS